MFANPLLANAQSHASGALPWTVATYMVNREGSRDQHATRELAYRDPSAFQAIVDAIVDETRVIRLPLWPASRARPFASSSPNPRRIADRRAGVAGRRSTGIAHRRGQPALILDAVDDRGIAERMIADLVLAHCGPLVGFAPFPRPLMVVAAVAPTIARRPMPCW